ncbi:MAG: aliphatic sulfonate transporter substrate-binding protein [Microbacteriaceae bacterium]|nr:aliphatic sulfonate transporter substrate-binding protein [Microbacteriaceae bacterium]
MNKKLLGLAAIAAAAALLLSACAGEGSAVEPSAKPTKSATDSWSSDTLNIDFATYNPLSLIIKDQGWLEAATGGKVKINWVQSAGSAAANLALRSGAIDVGSTAGSAALLARANGSPIKAIDVYSQPNWAAILVSKNSTITSVKDLQGKTVAANKGTDPYFFLIQALEKAGVPLNTVTIQNLAHADGKAALESGRVDAWSGLDPLLSTSIVVAGSKNIYDNPSFNTYGLLDATEPFLSKSPDLAQLVVNAYEKARAYAIQSPDKTAAILAKVAGINPTIASNVIQNRTKLDIDPVPGKAQTDVLKIVGPIFVTTGDVANQGLIDDALKNLFETKYAKKADPSAIG